MYELRCAGHSQLPAAEDGQACGALLRRVPDPMVLVGTRGKRSSSAAHDGRLWLRCPRPDCGTWNVFRLRSVGGPTEGQPG